MHVEKAQGLDNEGFRLTRVSRNDKFHWQRDLGVFQVFLPFQEEIYLRGFSRCQAKRAICVHSRATAKLRIAWCMPAIPTNCLYKS